MRSGTKREYSNIPLGISLRGSINQSITYRLRRGNGYAGSKNGVVYQDKYDYFVPASIRNSAGQPYRDLLQQAMYNWKNTLDSNTKRAYKIKAQRFKGIGGHNLYVKDFINANK